MSDDDVRSELLARRARLQARVFGAEAARATGTERAHAVDELRRLDARLDDRPNGRLAGAHPPQRSEEADGDPKPAAAASSSSATWLAAVAEAKRATWTERSEAAARHSETLRRHRVEEAAASTAGVFRLATLDGRDGDGQDGGGRDDVVGEGLPTGTFPGARRLRDAFARLTPLAVGLAIGVVVVAAGVGFGIGAQVASERGQAAADIRASADASGVATPAADDDAADWRALASQQALAEFSRNQLSGDLPPDSVSDDHFRADSFRLLLTGSIADWTGRVYAAKDIEGEICVVLVQPDSSYAAGCATPDQFARGGVQVTTNVSITIRAEEDGSESTITGVTATWPANGMTGLRFSSARSAG